MGQYCMLLYMLYIASAIHSKLQSKVTSQNIEMYVMNAENRSQKFSENKHVGAHNSKNLLQKALKGTVLLRKMVILRRELFSSKWPRREPFISVTVLLNKYIISDNNDIYLIYMA